MPTRDTTAREGPWDVEHRQVVDGRHGGGLRPCRDIDVQPVDEVAPAQGAQAFNRPPGAGARGDRDGTHPGRELSQRVRLHLHDEGRTGRAGEPGDQFALVRLDATTFRPQREAVQADDGDHEQRRGTAAA